MKQPYIDKIFIKITEKLSEIVNNHYYKDAT